ncbi:hypothetical protein J3459_010271 [Metarhizium acridum]|nr:hypothetical protein J3459_010271 [Metarhizium acridum]KAG8425394.1 hypothetical protein J3458_002099 [Metarhizium acridum]
MGREANIADEGGWIIHVAEVHGGSKILGAVLVNKTSCLNTKIAPIAMDFAEAQHQKELEKRREALRKRKEANALGPRPHPYKRTKLAFTQSYARYSDDSEYKDPSPDPHADEEFWVDGRE